ncbi:AAA family ATPase [Treponema sp.]|uniref:AAA family ATPase n=1 Tax=Treponema sp. TaxID=166 RepID=UPI003FD856E4
MAELKLFPIGLQDFSQIRRNGYYYVDKTDIVYKMTHTDRVYFFEPSAPLWKITFNFNLT